MVLHHIEHGGIGGVEADSQVVVGAVIAIEEAGGGGVGEVEQARIAEVKGYKKEYKCSKTIGSVEMLS